ncbi:inorganic diphosphatase [uncultured Allofournierella sp.]|uniref:inorganic diphosphatase n=1 Tax=uncultured Allofournierella sp. TaxID=1940258 RepID=UPI003752AD08
MLHMIVEQTHSYPMRMEYNPATNQFTETGYKSLKYERGFTKPYGWIKESGTPPSPHWDCILMTEREVELGDQLPIRVIGVFKRADLDHKYVAVEAARDIQDISQLTPQEQAELNKLYPHIGPGEGWFGQAEAAYCMEHHAKAL